MKPDINAPRDIIVDFFYNDDLGSYRKIVRKFLSAACTDGIYRDCDPGDLLFDIKLLLGLINATFLLRAEKVGDRTPVVDVFNTKFYCRGADPEVAWRAFPRTLSFKEYENPYRAFRRFFRCRSITEWQELMDDLLGFALCKDSILEVNIELDILSIYFHLVKLIEAAHLIYVREGNRL